MANKKLIIGVVGTIASGKGTIAAYLKEKYGATDFRFSTILRSLLTRLHKPHTREYLQDISTVLRSLFGEDVLAEVMASDVLEAKERVIVVEGIRRPADIKYLQNVPSFILVGVDASEEERYRRYVERDENPGDKDMTLEKWRERSNAETELLIPEVMQNAVVIWHNTGTKEELYRQIDSFMKSHA